MNKELIVPKLQKLGFIEDSSNEIYEKISERKICMILLTIMKIFFL